MITPEPLLHGSQNDTWQQRKPLVIFPCGAIHKDGKWLVTCGVNDLKSAWVELSHESLLSKMRPIGDVSDTIFGSNGLSEGEILSAVPVLANSRDEYESGEARGSTNRLRERSVADSRGGAQTLLEKRQANAAKARAALALKRKVQTDAPSFPRRKRRRKRFKRITAEARMKALKEFEAKKSIAET